MIIQRNGRYQAIRTNDEIDEIFSKQYDSLTDEEKQIVGIILEDALLRGYSPAIEYGSSVSYRVRPVSIETFIEDEFYLGPVIKTIYPKWKEEIKNIFNGSYEEVILGGSIGAGKTTAGIIILARLIYEISCLNDPQLSYQIAPYDKIMFPIVSITEAVAAESHGKLRSIIESSQYFQKHFTPEITDAHGIVFPNNIVVPPPMSNAQQTIGLNAFGGLIDESNFFKFIDSGSKKIDYMEQVYKSIKDRMQSRFMRNGRLPGILVMISSKGNVDSFTEKRIRSSVGDNTVYVSENAAYDIQPSERFSGNKFKVAVGNEVQVSRILGENDPIPEGMLVIDVPEEYRKSFEADLEKAIRDIAGIATVSITPFISKRSKIHEAIDPTRSHPFSEYIWTQDVKARFEWENFAIKNKDGSWKPKLNPSSPRHVHLDLSKSGDRTGFCISHIAGYKEVHRLGAEPEMAPIYAVDFILAIQAPANGEIVYSEIRKLIYDLSAHGFFIKKVTADSFQSASILQTLQHQGYNTEVISVDKVGPYDVLKQALYEDRVSYYRYQLLLDELSKLEKNWKTGKVDHPDNFSKDAADSLCGSIFTLSQAANMITPYIGEALPRSIEDIDDESWVFNGIPVESVNKNNNNNDWKEESVSKGGDVPLPFVMG